MNRAQAAHEAVLRDPREAVRLASLVTADPTAPIDERASAAWATGRAHTELDQIDKARSVLREGVGLAAEEGHITLAAQIRVSLAASLLCAGDTDGARDELDLADPHLATNGSRAMLESQRAVVEMVSGNLDVAVERFDETDRLLSASIGGPSEDGLEADAIANARLRMLVNRGIILAMTGDLDRAEVDLVEGRMLADGMNQAMLAAGAAQNLAYVHHCRGDVPTALEWFGRARDGYEAVGSPRRIMFTMESDLANVLLSGGLFLDAAAAADRAVAMAEATGNRVFEAEAHLLASRANLARASVESAASHVELAIEIFEQSGRPQWSAIARYVGLQVDAATGPPTAGLLAEAVELADHLAENGWPRESRDSRLLAGRMAIGLGDRATARDQLEPVAADRVEGSALRRSGAWLATALLLLSDGDRTGAKAALSSGMRLVEQYRATLGSSELRAHVTTNATDLAELGLRLSTEDAEPSAVFEWAERWHAGAVQVGAARPEPSTRLAAATTQLRQAHEQARLGSPSAEAGEDLDRTIARLEREVRDLSRAAKPSAAPSTVDRGERSAGASPDRVSDGPDEQPAVDLDAILAGLDHRTLVEYFTVDGLLHAVVAARQRVVVRRLGPLDRVADEIGRLTSALRRFAGGRAPTRARAATEAAASATAARLDELVLAPLDVDLGDELVIVPTAALQSLPWSCLPSLVGLAVTVAPSARHWISSPSHRPTAADPGAVGGVVLVAGPDLVGAEREVERLVDLHQRSVALTGGAATVQAVLTAVERADLVHIAAHGELRTDNPMFSAIQLADGPLTIYEIERLRRAPHTVVLSACDAARSSVRHGDELLGTAAALLQAGVTSVIGPLTVIPDQAVVPDLMVGLHRRLAGGEPPAESLAAARSEVPAQHRLTAASFVVIGGRVRPAAAIPDDGGLRSSPGHDVGLLSEAGLPPRR